MQNAYKVKSEERAGLLNRFKVASVDMHQLVVDDHGWRSSRNGLRSRPLRHHTFSRLIELHHGRVVKEGWWWQWGPCRGPFAGFEASAGVPASPE